MVRRALQRYATHADIDMPLMERLTQMHPDVTSWNVVVGTRTTEQSLVFTQPNSMLTRLIEGAELLMVGTRFGPKIRVDFSLHVRNDHANTVLTEKAASFAEVFAKEPSMSPGSAQQPQRPLGNLSVDPDRIQGSVELSAKEFERWNEQGGFARRLQEPAARGE